MISSISSTQALLGVQPQATTTSTPAVAQTASDSSSLSGLAELFQKLADLQKSSPSKFQEAMKEIAQKLKDAAAAATDPSEQKALTELADAVTKAAQTGDLSSLEKPSAAPGGGGAGAGSATKTFDPADANQDGVVTEQEQAAYDAAQAAPSGATSTALQTYGKVLHSAADAKESALFSSLNSIVDSVAASSV